MSERSRPLDMFLVDYMCDECGKPLAYTGEMQPTAQPNYIHKCINGHYDKFKVRYPDVRYVVKEDNED